jgi:DNA-binding response OmpR family regulator
MISAETILIVEDNPLIASTVAMMLENELAYEAIIARSVASARALIDDRIRFAVLDVEVEDGLTFSLALQLLRRNIPVVFASGSDPGKMPSELAPTPFLRKPVSLRDLVAAARHRLSLHNFSCKYQ